MNLKIEIAKAVAVTAELTGTLLSEMALEVMVEELAVHDLASVLNALNRCRRELNGRLTLASVLERLDTGLPSADEAFALMAEAWRNEALTVVVPKIALDCSGPAANLFCSGDKTGARMAFRDAYNRAAAEALAKGGKVQWGVSQGHDREQARKALMQGYREGKLSRELLETRLPSEAVAERHEVRTGNTLCLTDKTEALKRLEAIRSLLADKKGLSHAV